MAKIIDSVTDEYLAHHQVVFPSDEERKKTHFAFIRARKKDWERSRICMYPGCAERSITRSHTIPRAALLLIAENGHLLHPEVNQVLGRLEMARVGVNQASTFAGFCREHELEFQEFESIVQLQDQRDFLLQLFRTVCREITLKEHELRTLTDSAREFRRLRDDWARKRIDDVVRRRFRVGADFSTERFDIQADDIVSKSEKWIDETARGLALFTERFFQPFLNARSGKNLPINLIRHTLPERLPLALAGRGNFFIRIEDTGEEREMFAVMNVLPTTTGSEIFISVPDDHKGAMDSLLFYMSQFMGKGDDREGALRMIESWMLHGSDHWFLSPSAWLALSETQQSTAIKAVLDIDKVFTGMDYNIGSQPTVSLLDAVRFNPRPV